eukprot:12928511-Prorocentrum_lima.AAC.1
MRCSGPKCPTLRDGEDDLHLPSSSLPFSTPLPNLRGTMDGRLGLCRADGVLDILLLSALPETFTCYS